MPTPLSRDISLAEDELLAHLAECLPRSASVHYRRYGPWLADPDALSWKGQLTGNGIPGLQAKHFLRLKLRSQDLKALPFSLAALQLNHNGTRVRGFDLGQSICVKLVKATGIAAQAQRDEIALRHRVASLDVLRLPHIQNVEERGEHLFFREELIIGRRFSLRKDASLFVQSLPQLLKMWHGLGLSYQPLAQALTFPSTPTFPELDEALQQARAANPLVPVARLHGDLISSNLCVSRGELVFLDWDRSYVGPVFADPLMMVAKEISPATDQIFTATLRLMTDQLGTAPKDLRHMMAAYMASRFARRGKSVRHFWKLLNQHLGG